MKSQIARVLVLALLAFVLATPLLAMPANATYRQRSIQAVASADVLRIAWLSDVDTLDPSLAYDSRSIEVLTQVYDTVVTQDAQTLDVRPELATAWQVSADGKTYTFNIRKPVSFHEGQTLQASDVAYSIHAASCSLIPAVLNGLSLSQSWATSQVTSLRRSLVACMRAIHKH